MIDINSLEKYDVHKMYKVYDKWPQIAKEQFDENIQSIEFQKVEHIIFAGMGGSGAISDIFASILSKTNIHVEIVKGYLLPKTVDKNSLVIVTSVSGNTEESLNVLMNAKKIGCKIIAFSDGGLMKKYCVKNLIEHREIKMQHSPRASFISYLFTMLKTLIKTLPINPEEVYESIYELESLKKKISSGNLTESNPSLLLAKWISGIPLIYYPHGLEAAAIRFKNSLQENSKMHVITEDVIEACHNGIVSWIKPSNVKPILLRGKDDFEKTSERWNILKIFFEKNEIEFKEINSVEGNILSKLVTLIYLLDYASIYKAILDKVDPTMVDPIDFVKTKLS